MNIILIGFMGSGKSAVGRKLAEELSMDYIDTDELIEKAEKMSINDIFAQKGEPYFRDLETNVVKTLQDYDNFVISAGGGMVLREENVTMLKEIGPLVLLWADAEIIYERVKKEPYRPLLKVADPKTEIELILKQREPVYNEVAEFKIDTSQLGVEEAAREIISHLRL